MKALACTVGMMLVATAWSTPAAALDLTLDDVVSVGNPFVAAVETSGYRFSGPSLRTIDTPGSTYVGDGSAVYLAQTVGPVGGVTLQRIDGMPFDLYQFAAAGLFAAGGGSPTPRTSPCWPSRSAAPGSEPSTTWARPPASSTSRCRRAGTTSSS